MDAAGLKEAVNNKILNDVFPKRQKRLPER